MKRFLLAFAILAGLAATTVPASADLVYTLNVDSDLSTGHDFGSVTLHQDSGNTTTVTVTVQLNLVNLGIGFANTGAGYAVAWDLTSGVVPTSIGINAATPNPGVFTVATTGGNFLGSYTASPFTSGANGNPFNYAIDYTGATGPSNNQLIFDVTRTAGLALSNFIGNPSYFFAVDIITSTGATRNVAAGLVPTTQIPEPQAWALFFAGLIGLAVLQRRRQTARAA